MHVIVFIIIIVLFLLGVYLLFAAASLTWTVVGLLLIWLFSFTATFYTCLALFAVIGCARGGPPGCAIYDDGMDRLVRSYFDVMHVEEDAPRSDDESKTPVIYVMNHLPNSVLDALVLPALRRVRTRIVYKQPKSPGIVDGVLRTCRGIPVQHGGGFDQFMESCTTALSAGDNILIYPEGRHSHSKAEWWQLSAFQTGAFALSQRTGVPIVPILLDVSGCEYLESLLFPGEIHIWILSALHPAHFADAVTFRDRTRQIMNDGLRHRMQQRQCRKT